MHLDVPVRRASRPAGTAVGGGLWGGETAVKPPTPRAFGGGSGAEPREENFDVFSSKTINSRDKCRDSSRVRPLENRVFGVFLHIFTLLSGDTRGPCAYNPLKLVEIAPKVPK